MGAGSAERREGECSMEPVLPLTHPFTLFHTALSVVAILTGLVVARGLLRNQSMPGWTTLFLSTAVLTTATGFLFPFRGLTPALATGVVSSGVLALTLIALYAQRLAGGWRAVYVVGAMVSVYLNVFVLIVQVFQKVPALHALAPTQKEPPFAIAQVAALLVFAVATVIAVRRFHPRVGDVASAPIRNPS
jgi:hypothetical protein